MNVQNLIERQRANLKSFHAIMSARKAEAPRCPRAAYLEEKGWKNITFPGRDTTFKTRPYRGLAFTHDDFRVSVYTMAGRCVEVFDVRSPDAQTRLNRYTD